MKKIYSLQYLRALAALFVVLYHINDYFLEKYQYTFLLGVFKVGYVGVDIFFVISGFIILYIHFNDIGKRDRFKMYLTKRFIRIFPLYWLISLAVIPLYFLFPNFGNGTQRDIEVIIKSLFLIPQENSPILVVAWTLSYEVLFYLIFGTFFIATSKRLARYGFIFLWIVGIIIAVVTDKYISDSIFSKFLFNPYNLEFILGALVAVLFRFKLNYKLSIITFSLGITTFIIAWVSQYFNLLIINNHILIWAIPSFLIVLGFIIWEMNFKVPISNIFLYLGDASYSIYLIHFPAIYFLNKIFVYFNAQNKIGLLSMSLTTAILSIIAGCICHKLIEKPLIKVFQRYFFNVSVDLRDWKKVS